MAAARGRRYLLGGAIWGPVVSVSGAMGAGGDLFVFSGYSRAFPLRLECPWSKLFPCRCARWVPPSGQLAVHCRLASSLRSSAEVIVFFKLCLVFYLCA